MKYLLNALAGFAISAILSSCIPITISMTPDEQKKLIERLKEEEKTASDYIENTISKGEICDNDNYCYRMIKTSKNRYGHNLKISDNVVFFKDNSRLLTVIFDSIAIYDYKANKIIKSYKYSDFLGDEHGRILGRVVFLKISEDNSRAFVLEEYRNNYKLITIDLQGDKIHTINLSELIIKEYYKLNDLKIRLIGYRSQDNHIINNDRIVISTINGSTKDYYIINLNKPREKNKINSNSDENTISDYTCPLYSPLENGYLKCETREISYKSKIITLTVYNQFGKKMHDSQFTSTSFPSVLYASGNSAYVQIDKKIIPININNVSVNDANMTIDIPDKSLAIININGDIYFQSETTEDIIIKNGAKKVVVFKKYLNSRYPLTLSPDGKTFVVNSPNLEIYQLK